MKTNLVKGFAGLVIALTVAVISVSASTVFDGNKRNSAGHPGDCVSQLSGLNQQQINQINALEKSHQTTMAELREKRRSTTDVTEKANIRTEMDTQVAKHRSDVKALLNSDQQKQYDQSHAAGGKHLNQKNGKSNGHGQGTGNCKGRR
jgi:hypothetical protein